jgi:hypothetical protein
MKNLLKKYYELTVIPSIVLGCITTLGWYGFHWANEGIVYVTSGEVIFAFLFFLILMTIEDVFKIVKPFVTNFYKKYDGNNF